MDLELLEGLLKRKEHAQLAAKRIECSPNLSVASILPLLQEYMMLKLHLRQEDIGSHSIDTLMRVSIERLLEVHKGLLEDITSAAGCDGASSVQTKKALFYIALQKEMGISLAASKLVHCDTVAELAEMISEALNNRPHKEDAEPC